MNAVKIGQVWQDKDKRRNTRIEIIDTDGSHENGTVTGLVVGTETERQYMIYRLTERWRLIKDVADEVSLSNAADTVRDGKAKLELVAGDTSWIVAVPERTRAKQPTYMRKLVSPVEPRYFLRMTEGKLEEYGHPIDPWGNQMELEG